MYILGIETSCDETSASVVENGTKILSNVVSSSLRYHKRFGGVIPEIATRHHVENIDKVVNLSLKDAGITIDDIDAVAVTEGPGLVGALLIGISFAKTLAYSLGVPIIGVDHIDAHIYSAIMDKKKPEFPFIGLVVSGGHTRLCLVKDFDDHIKLGDTLDDAIGEAYDKVAKIFGLGYPGGPIIDRLAKRGNPRAIKFTCRPIDGGFDFSFSGIKTAVLYYVKGNNKVLSERQRFDVLASFQEAVLGTVVDASLKALEKYNLHTLVIGGGVSANSRLREIINSESIFRNFKVYFPELKLCSDNAAMVAGFAYHLIKKGYSSGLDMSAKV